jgi:hypothetical protein
MITNWHFIPTLEYFFQCIFTIIIFLDNPLDNFELYARAWIKTKKCNVCLVLFFKKKVLNVNHFLVPGNDWTLEKGHTRTGKYLESLLHNLFNLKKTTGIVL